MAGKFTVWFVAAASGLLTISAMAQAPPATKHGPSEIYTFGRTMDRAAIRESRALDGPELNLTRAQSTEIDRLTDLYVEDRRQVDEQFPVKQGEMPKPDAILARQQALVKYNTAVTRLLSPQQIKAWQEVQAQRRPPPSATGRPFGL